MRQEKAEDVLITLNVVKAIHREQWIEQEVQQGKLTVYVYQCLNKNEPLCVLTDNNKPPPYDDCDTCHSTEPRLPSHAPLLPVLLPTAQPSFRRPS